MITVSQMAAQSGLSRSTLLYYDRIGLLRPDYRTAAGYRLYNAADRKRLELIRRFRSTGLSLARIERLLERPAPTRSTVITALQGRLTELNREIATLRRQQQVVANLLQQEGSAKRTRIMDKPRWIALLRAAGMDDAEMRRWHVEFERQSPEAHQDFLESLGISNAEIRQIRRASSGRLKAAEKGTRN